MVVYPRFQSLPDGSDGYRSLVLAILPVFEASGCQYDDPSRGRYGLMSQLLVFIVFQVALAAVLFYLGSDAKKDKSTDSDERDIRK